jgi:Holliday junction resolvase RusA-like endonuclease
MLSLDRTPVEESEILLTNISVPPALNNLFFNIPGGGRAKTQGYKAWRRAAGFEALAQRQKPLKGRVDIVITIEDGASKADVDGLLKGPIDLLVEMGLIEGDGPAHVRSAKAVYGECKSMRIEVRKAA